MTPFEIFLTLSIGVLVIGMTLLFLQTRTKNVAVEIDVSPLKEKITELQTLLEGEKSEKNKLLGQNKQMYAEQVSMKEEIKALSKERDTVLNQLSKFEAREKQMEKEFTAKIQDLANARQKFDEEKQRVIREDEEARANAEADRDRIWAEHENNVIAQLTSLCRSPQLGFAHYTNTNLPDDFDGSLKPDFMIEFLDQYIIFDAKKSKQESLQTYINNTIKTTVQKVKKNPRIAPMVYLVVPAEAIAELKSFVHSLDGYTIYIVSPEALAPILASLKKITTYEFADQMDPQQRENIIQLIAEFDFHINLRNAADILLTKMGTTILEKAQQVEPEIYQEVALKKQPMNAKASLAATELKKIVSNLTLQNVEVQQMLSPKAAVKKQDLKIAEDVVMKTLLDA